MEIWCVCWDKVAKYSDDVGMITGSHSEEDLHGELTPIFISWVIVRYYR